MSRVPPTKIQTLFRWSIALLGVWVASGLGCQLIAEGLWFQEVGYVQIFWTQLFSRSLLFAIGTLFSLGFLGGNLAIAHRNHKPAPYFSLSLPILLPLTLSLGLLLEGLLLHYSQAVLTWSPALTVGNLPLPIALLGLGLVGAIGLLIYPQVIWAIAGALSLAFGSLLAGQWAHVLQWLHPVAFGQVEPLFAQDISFHVFSLPVWELLNRWLLGLSLSGLAAIALVYLLAGNSLSQGRVEVSRSQARHLRMLAGGGMLAIAGHNWIQRYHLLYSTQGVVVGAGFTDVRLMLPALTLLSLLAGAIALVLLGSRRGPAIALLVSYGLVWTIATLVLPIAVQRLIVQPSELEREKPFIRHNIALTREAFDLETIEVKLFNPTTTLTYADLRQNDRTIRNIRLWDTRPLLETNRQLQQIRPYYKFFDADIDRYPLASESDAAAVVNQPPVNQQVLIAARELDYAAVPKAAQTWENEHLVYTHGYGFTLSPVNRVAPGGLPDYFVKDIGTGATNSGELVTSSQLQGLPIAPPRLYYGEGTNTYILTGTRVQELDYPSGNDNVYTTYTGAGGIPIGGWRRMVFARSLHDWQMLFTHSFTPNTRLLFRRTIQPRIQAIAPFLHFDHDPYLVVAEAGPQNSLFWIVDAYTTSDRYPYSTPAQLGGDRVNYIRNSVKVVVDAYSGAVSFYSADPTDPILRTWAAIFPGMFQPLSQMPVALQSHLRYPIELFQVQATQLMTFHMTDAQVFYNREDQWQIPTEIYGNKPQLVEPYYLILKLPTADAEEFVLLLPFTPNQRTNLTAWLASRSDGKNSGKSLLYLFPKQQLVYGTEQIEARINQDPVISQQISLWNRQGSRAVQGNLLVIPIEQSLLYVEPLYLEAEQNSLPTLVRVIVVYENRIVMAETLEQVLQAIFQPPKPTAPVVRPVQ